MKMLLVIFSVVVNLMVAYSKIRCDCGYGGLCLEVPRAVMTDCSYCERVSYGFYEADGHTIVDHCASNPCVAGDCVRTFGGFFCRCPADRIGHRCELLRSGQWYEDFSTSEHLYVYFQVQPDLVGTNLLTLVYNSKGNSWLSASSDRIKVWPIISVTDGRVYYPNHHFVAENVKDSCVNQAAKHPDIFDARVCELLPSGTVDAFRFDVVESYSVGMEDRDPLTIPGIGVIGGTDIVNIKVRLQLDRQFIDVYDQNYTIFNYYDRASYRCLIDHTFVGCSPYYKMPRELNRQDSMEAMVINKKVTCEGVLVIKTEWRSQKIVQPEDVSENMTGFDVPTYMIGSTNMRDISRPPFYFGRGLLMLEYVYTLRGAPPHMGSDQLFHQIGRCFIKIRGGAPYIATDGGTFRTMSCLNAFALPIKSYNPNFSSSDFDVVVECNVTSDGDCDRKKLTVPILIKTTKPECNSYYKFTFEVEYISSVTGPSKIAFSTVIHFIERTEELSVICLDNCLPYINPYRRTILLAESNPYSPRPVKWEVKNEDTVVKERCGEVLAFRPLSASRILRVHGEYMQSPVERISNGSFTVYSDELGLIASLTTACDNIAVDLARGFDGIYFNDTNEAVNLIPKSYDQYEFEGVTFSVYAVNLRVKDDLLLVATNYGEELTNIKPDWNTIRICLRDIWRTEGCREFNITVNYKDPYSRLVTMESLILYWQEFDLLSLLSKTIVFLIQSLTAKSDKSLSWTTSLADRRKIVDIMLKFNLVNQNGVKKVFFIVSLLSYSGKGNKAEDLEEFKDEPLQKALDIIEWMKLRSETLQLLDKTIDILAVWMTQYGSYLVRHDLSSQRRLILRTWSLAYHQDYVYVSLMKKVRASEERYFRGEAFFYAYLDGYSLYAILYKVTKFMAIRARLYAGIYFIGNENVLSYIVRTSYAGILSCLDKSNGNRDTDERFSDYIFEAMNPRMNWVKLMVLAFPPPPPSWEDREFILVVMAVKSSLTKYDDNNPEGNPMVNVYLASRKNEPVKGISQGYNVSIPYLRGNDIGTYVPEEKTIGYLKKPLDRENSPKYLLLTTVNLPNHLRNWRLKIILDPGVSVKAKASVEGVPEYEDAKQAPELIVYTSPEGLSYSVLDILPVNGSRLIPSRIYLAILAVKVPNPNVPTPIKLQSSLYFCQTFVLSELEHRPCEGLYQPVTLEQQYFNCTCTTFGVVFTSKGRITGSAVFAGPHQLEIPFMFHWDATIVVVTAVVLVVVVTAFALWKDRKRHAESLIYMEDNYVKDNHLLVVAVYTSPRCSAGTTSKVAIKVEGFKSSSRVHLLQSSKRSTLQAGQDNWFVMTTNEPLGKLSHVQLWVDFRSRDDWHCTRILFYDVSMAKWYCVEVNKWINFSKSENQESRIWTFQVTELESTDNALQSLPYGFCNHFAREISNNHLVLSMVLLHHRSLKTLFMMGNVLLIKIFSLFLSIWCLEEVAYTWLYNNYYLDYYIASELIGLKSRTFEDASLSAVMALLVTVPIITLYKALHVSRFLQKRTTNPLYLSAKDLIASSKKSIISLKGRKSSIFTLRPRKSTKLSIYNPFDTKFGLQRGWRLVAALLFGPTQFRCVNVDASVFSKRVFAKLIILRIGTVSLMLALFASVCCIEFGTEYWRKTKSTAFIFFMAVLLDSFLITPSFMLISSLVSYYILKVSNKEIYMISEETKFKQPPCLDFKDYINVATREEYKPTLTTVLEGSRKKSKKTLLGLHILNHIMALLALGLCMHNIGPSVTNKFNVIASASEYVTIPITLLDRKSDGIDRVHSRPDAIDFIYTNLAEVVDKWYNGKPISDNKDVGKVAKMENVEEEEESSIQRGLVFGYYSIISLCSSNKPCDQTTFPLLSCPYNPRAYHYIIFCFFNVAWEIVIFNPRLLPTAIWDCGGYCRPLGAGNLIMLFKVNNSKTYYRSADIEDYPGLFPPPCGYLSDDSQRTDPIKLAPGTTITFNKFSSFSMTSRSRESYPFQGHNITLQTSHDWSSYYVTLRKMVDAAVNRRDHCDVRALIFSWNSVNIFSKKMLTLNALIEFLPSGVASAKIEIDAVRFQRDGWHTYVTKCILSTIFVWNICFVAILFSISTKHIVQDRILNCLFLMGSITVTIIFAIMEEVKFEEIRGIIYDPPDYFRDLGIVYAHERAWSYAMASLIVVTTLIMAFLVLRTLGVRLLKMSYYCVLCAAFMLGMVLLHHLCTEAFRSAIDVISFTPIFSRIDAVTMNYSTAPSMGLLVTMFFTIAVLYKLTTASVIIASMHAEDGQTRAVHSSEKKNPTALFGNRKIDRPQMDKPADPKKTVGDNRVDDKISLLK